MFLTFFQFGLNPTLLKLGKVFDKYDTHQVIQLVLYANRQ